MNFLNMLSSGASIFNFNLLNTMAGFGLGSTLEVSTPKTLHPQQIIKDPNACAGLEEKEKETEKQGEREEAKVELFTKQQQLINQYMHLNIQLLSRKLETLEHNEKNPQQEEGEAHNEPKSSKKKIKKANTCGHPDKEHYAKGMCNNCYHKFGRNKKPWNCPHDKLYANGMCQNCYINSYNRKRREEKEDKIDSFSPPSEPQQP